MAFDVNAARQSGYSDDEILQHLTESRKFDVSGAVNAGYSKDDIINHLATTPSTSTNTATDQTQQKPGLLKQLYQGIATPFAKLGVQAYNTAAGLGNTIMGKNDQAMKSLGATRDLSGIGLGKIAPLVTPTTAGEDNGKVAGSVVHDIGNIIGTGGDIAATVLSPELKGASLGTKVAVRGGMGAVSGGSQALERGGNIGDVISGAVTGAGTNIALGGVLEAAGSKLKQIFNPKGAADDIASQIAAKQSQRDTLATSAVPDMAKLNKLDNQIQNLSNIQSKVQTRIINDSNPIIKNAVKNNVPLSFAQDLGNLSDDTKKGALDIIKQITEPTNITKNEDTLQSFGNEILTPLKQSSDEAVKLAQKRDKLLMSSFDNPIDPKSFLTGNGKQLSNKNIDTGLVGIIKSHGLGGDIGTGGQGVSVMGIDPTEFDSGVGKTIKDLASNPPKTMKDLINAKEILSSSSNMNPTSDQMQNLTKRVIGYLNGKISDEVPGVADMNEKISGVLSTQAQIKKLLGINTKATGTGAVKKEIQQLSDNWKELDAGVRTIKASPNNLDEAVNQINNAASTVGVQPIKDNLKDKLYVMKTVETIAKALSSKDDAERQQLLNGLENLGIGTFSSGSITGLKGAISVLKNLSSVKGENATNNMLNAVKRILSTPTSAIFKPNRAIQASKDVLGKVAGSMQNVAAGTANIKGIPISNAAVTKAAFQPLSNLASPQQNQQQQ